jgi:hypothetical protein
MYQPGGARFGLSGTAARSDPWARETMSRSISLWPLSKECVVPDPFRHHQMIGPHGTTFCADALTECEATSTMGVSVR